MAEYISREAVNDLIEDVRNNHFILMRNRVTLALLKSKVAEIPAADVQPVKRGKWNIKEDHFHSNIIMNYAECSCCGHTCSTTESEHNNYCPKCGARMDE